VRRGGKVDFILSHWPEMMFKENGALVIGWFQYAFSAASAPSMLGARIDLLQGSR
jgi:hypothetical protein